MSESGNLGNLSDMALAATLAAAVVAWRDTFDKALERARMATVGSSEWASARQDMAFSYQQLADAKRRWQKLFGSTVLEQWEQRRGEHHDPDMDSGAGEK